MVRIVEVLVHLGKVLCNMDFMVVDTNVLETKINNKKDELQQKLLEPL
jgi:hypothetical protein